MKKKTDLHVFRVGTREKHQAIAKSFKVVKLGTRRSGIVGKANSQLCPAVTKTS